MDKDVLKMPTEKKIDSNFVTVECLLAFDKDEDKGRVLALMRKFSSMVRFAYCKANSGVLHRKRAKSEKACFWLKKTVRTAKEKTLNRQKKRDTKTKMGGKKVRHFAFKG